MRILMVTTGTQGDVQPFLALALGCQRSGHDVRLATHQDFAEMITGRGIAFDPICGNFRTLMESPLGRDWLESGDGFSKYRKAVAALFGPLARSWLEDQVAVVRDAELVLSHPLAIGVGHEAERRGIPHLLCPLVPFVPTGAFNLFMRDNILLRGPGNRLLWRMQMRFAWEVFDATHRKFREEVGLPPMGAKDLWTHYIRRGLPHLNLFSEVVVPPPRDWPSQVETQGFCFLESAAEDSLPEGLEDFLSAGPPPVYIGFGSMTGYEPQQLAELTVAAVRKAGQRAIIVSGWSNVETQSSDDLYCTHRVPHDRVLPRTAAAVHHGGAGTLAAGLRAGKPTAVVAFFGDQHFWGHRAASLGVGPRPLAKQALTVDSLANCLAKLTSTPQFEARAREIGSRLQAEDGVARTVERIEQLAQTG